MIAPDIETAVAELQALGVRFDADRFGRLALGLEGGHSVRRVVHAGGSATGRRMLRQLSALVAQEPRIEVLENARARALWPLGGEAGAGGRKGEIGTGGPVGDGGPGEEPLGGATEVRCRGVRCEDGRTIGAPAARAPASRRRTAASVSRTVSS